MINARKTVIILQNGPVFTVDIAKISQPENWDLHLIINDASYQCLLERNQHIFFKSITLAERFDFDSLSPILTGLLSAINKATAVLATNTESLVGVTGALREHLAIKGLDAYLGSVFSNKVIMKEHLSTLSIAMPRYLTFDPNRYEANNTAYCNEIAEYLAFPIIAKPINSAGSHGVTKILTMSELVLWATTNDKVNFELDEFIDGQLYHCDSFVREGRILYTGVCRYNCPPQEFFQGSHLGGIALPSDHPAYLKLKDFNDTILKNIFTELSGVTHLEVFEKSNGELIFLEVANRGGGAGIPRMYKKILDVDLFAAHFLLQCDDNYSLNPNPTFNAAWLQFSARDNIHGVDVLPKISSHMEIIFQNNHINTSLPCKSLRDYSLLIALWNKDFTELENDFNKLAAFKPINYA